MNLAPSIEGQQAPQHWTPNSWTKVVNTVSLPNRARNTQSQTQSHDICKRRARAGGLYVACIVAACAACFQSMPNDAHTLHMDMYTMYMSRTKARIIADGIKHTHMHPPESQGRGSTARGTSVTPSAQHPTSSSPALADLAARYWISRRAT